MSVALPYAFFQSDDGTGFTLQALGSQGDGALVFTQLQDVPSSYSGQGGKSVRVNSGATALEFYTPISYPVQVITDTTLNSTTATQTFSSIPQTFNHLRLLSIARSTHTTFTGINGIFNGDNSGSHYLIQYISGADTSITGALVGPQNAFSAGEVTGTNSDAGDFAVSELFIPFYASTTQYKYAKLRNGYASTSAVFESIQTSRWASTAAITSIAMSPSSGSFASGTRFILYGVL